MATALAIVNAQLPASYEQAKRAIAECIRLDECKQWSDQAKAIAAYARMSEDETLIRDATRWQALAVRRLGELLAEIEPRPGVNQNFRDDSDPKVLKILTRKDAASAAGISESQRKTALRVAAIPKQKFTMDFRRSGSQEAQAGGVDPLALATKLANSISQSKRLQDAYLPKRATTVRLADEARRRGRAKLRSERGMNEKLQLSGQKSCNSNDDDAASA